MDVDTLLLLLSEFQDVLDRMASRLESKEMAHGETQAEALADSVQAGQCGEPSIIEQVAKTGSKLVEESCQQINLLQIILRHSPVGLAVVSGQDLIYRLATPAYRASLPQPEIEITGRRYEEVWAENVQPGVTQAIRSAIDGHQGTSLDQVEYLRYGTSPRSLTLRVFPVTWEGQVAALILMQQASHPAKIRNPIAQPAGPLHQQAGELDAIITAMAEAVTIFDASGTITRANPAAVDLFGFDPLEMNITDLMDILSLCLPDGSPVDVSDLFFERAMRGETTVRQRLLLVDQNGRERIVRASAAPLYHGRAVSVLVAVWYDVTEREHLVEQLEIQQSRLETIILNAPEAILVVDEDGQLVMSNPAGEQIFGRPLPYYQEYEALTSLQICYEDFTPCNPRNFPLICSALDGEHFQRVELAVLLPEGTARSLIASTAPIVDRKGNLNGAVGVFQDITLQKLAEQNLRSQVSRSQMTAMLSKAFAERGLNYNELLETIVSEAGRVFSDICSLDIHSEDALSYVTAAVWSRTGPRDAGQTQPCSEVSLPIKQSITGEVLETGQMLSLPEISIAQLSQSMPQLASILHLIPHDKNAGLLSVPLRAHGRRIGVLHFIRAAWGQPFSQEDQAFLQDLSDRAALAVEDARLFERETQRAQEFLALNRATTALLSTIDLEILLSTILDSARQAIPGAEYGILYLSGAESSLLEVRAGFGETDISGIASAFLPHAERCQGTRQAAIIHETLPLVLENKQQAVNSAIVAPLVLSQPGPDTWQEGGAQRVLGVLALFGVRTGLFNANHLRLLNTFAATATAALQNATLYAQVQRLATTDPVTEQYNRHKFFELGELEMNRFRRYQTPLSAIMLDLDNFKDINDTYGHAAGDVVLKVVAQRCRAGIRVVDILGRYGGDEFGILLPGAMLIKASEIAERIRQTVISAPVTTNRGPIEVSISLGVAQASRDMESLSTLLGRADAALYEAKQSGRNKVVQG